MVLIMIELPIFEKNKPMKQEVNPQETTRAAAFDMWMSSPMPMVTLCKTFDVGRLVKASRKRGIRFNALLCWCIGMAAKGIDEFYFLPEGGKLFRYDSLAINVIVENCKGGLSSCDIPVSDDLRKFSDDYEAITHVSAKECRDICLDDSMIVGTSAVVLTELDCIVNQYTEKFANPLLMWGKYRKGLLKTTLPISMQFHHVQMDGGQAARFLLRLQEFINKA